MARSKRRDKRVKGPATRLDVHRSILARVATYGEALDEVHLLAKEFVPDLRLSPEPTEEEAARYLSLVNQNLSHFTDHDVRRLGRDLYDVLHPAVRFMKDLFPGEPYDELHRKFDKILALLQDVRGGHEDPDVLRDKLAMAIVGLRVHTPYYRALAYSHYFDTIADIAGKYEVMDHPAVQEHKAKYGKILASKGAHEYLKDPYVISYLFHHALAKEGVNLSEKNPKKLHLALDSAMHRFADYLRIYSGHPAVGGILSTRIDYFYRIPPEELVLRFKDHVGSRTLRGLNRTGLAVGWHEDIEKDLEEDPSLVRTLPIYSQLVAAGADPEKAWTVVRFAHHSPGIGAYVLRGVSPDRVVTFSTLLEKGHDDLAHAILATRTPLSKVDRILELLDAGVPKAALKEIVLSKDHDVLDVLAKHSKVVPPDVLSFFAENRKLAHHLPHLASALESGKLKDPSKVLSMLRYLPGDDKTVKRFWENVDLVEDLGHNYLSVVRWGDIDELRKELDVLRSAGYRVSDAVGYRGNPVVWHSLLTLAKSGIVLPEGSYDNAHHVFAMLTGIPPQTFAEELRRLRSKEIIGPGDLKRLEQLENLRIPRPKNPEALAELVDEAAGIAVDLARAYHRRLPSDVRREFRNAVADWVDRSLGLFLHYTLKNRGIPPEQAGPEHLPVVEDGVKDVLRRSKELLMSMSSAQRRDSGRAQEVREQGGKTKKSGLHPKLAASLRRLYDVIDTILEADVRMSRTQDGLKIRLRGPGSIDPHRAKSIFRLRQLANRVRVHNFEYEPLPEFSATMEPHNNEVLVMNPGNFARFLERISRYLPEEYSKRAKAAAKQIRKALKSS